MILQLENISLSFTRQSKDSFKILDGCNLAVPQGKITALVGGNGAGKTTLFNVISGFNPDFSGDIYFKNEKISGLSAHQIAQKGIGRMFQAKQLMPDLTILENMKIASDDKTGEFPFEYLFRKKKIDLVEVEKEHRAISILNSLFGNGNKYVDMLHQKASVLSYGEQRLIALARLLMSNNQLLLLDEPTAGVNPVYIDTIKSVILKMVIESQLSVLLIEHNMRFVQETADNCAFLMNGTIAFQGTATDVLSNQDVRNSYLGL